MHKSILDAVKSGSWDFEVPDLDDDLFEAADAMPGSAGKVAILAERVRRGLPLWHVGDRRDMETPTGPRGRRPDPQSAS
jgi:hypothetical protein